MPLTVRVRPNAAYLLVLLIGVLIAVFAFVQGGRFVALLGVLLVLLLLLLTYPLSSAPRWSSRTRC